MKNLFKVLIVSLSVVLVQQGALADENEELFSSPDYKELNINKVKELFAGDILVYSNVPEEEFNTPLKKKKFLESQSYKALEKKAQEDITKLCKQTFELSVPFTSEYDLTKGNFRIKLPYYEFYNDLTISTLPENFTKYSGSYFFLTPNVNEDEAYVIEISDCSVVYFFNFTGKLVRNQMEVLPKRVEIRDNDSGNVLYFCDLKYTTEPIKEVDAFNRPPQFPGGEVEMWRWISNNIIYPAQASEEGVSGKVIISFFVEKDGTLSEIAIVKSVHPALDAEAKRLVRKMPKWLPGMSEGEPVRAKFTLPITFKLK